jgi:N6-L-threonylcarbamoyladenine synthase
VTLLAFETSCDETSAAVIQNGRVLASVVSSQIRLHAEYGGVVPELAAREHLRNLIPVANAALSDAKIEPEQLDAFAATQGPGLPAALMAGLKAAQTMAFVLQRPFVGIHHHEAHLYSPWISDAVEAFNRQKNSDCRQDADSTFDAAEFTAFEPNISLIVSGGHTMLVHVESELKHCVLGSTVDDAAGECFDKVGKLIGLPYPAGPEIDRLAEHGDAKAFDFPRPMIGDANDDFSFSGLKTSVRYFLRDHPEILDDAQRLRDLCASVQAAIVDVLVAKTIKAAKRLGVSCVTASGGVTCNRALRRQLAAACERDGLKLRLTRANLCTDNAAMIGVLAERKLILGVPLNHFSEDVFPNWPLDEIFVPTVCSCSAVQKNPASVQEITSSWD